MRKKKKDVNLGMYSPPDNGSTYSEEGAQKEDGVDKTASNLSADDNMQEGKRKNKKKASVNLGIY